MYDYLQRLRMQNLFGDMGNIGNMEPTFQTQSPMFQQPMIDDSVTVHATPPEYDAGARMRELYTPDTTNIDKLNAMTGQYPEMQKPGKLRSIASIALGTLGDLYGPSGSGSKAFDEGMGYGKHNRAVADWKAKLAPVEQAATYERQSNNQNRQFATSTVSAEQRQQKDEAYAQTQNEKTRIAEMRAQVYEFKAKNPMAKIISPKGGNIQAINPITGGVIADFGPAGTMSDADRINLEQTNAMARQDDAQASRTQYQKTAAENAEELESMRQTGREAIQMMPPRSTTVEKPETSTQEKTKYYNNAQKVANTRPDLRQFIKPGQNTGDFEIEPPGKTWYGGTSGPTPEQYEELKTLIYGTPPVKKTNVPPPDVKPTQPVNTPPPAPNTGGRATGAGPNASGNIAPLTKQVRNKTTGEVITVISTDGGKSWKRQ